MHKPCHGWFVTALIWHFLPDWNACSACNTGASSCTQSLAECGAGRGARGWRLDDSDAVLMPVRWHKELRRLGMRHGLCALGEHL